MALVPMMVAGDEDQADPEVLVAKCCENQTGLLLWINGAWWLFRDSKIVSGQLATRAFRVAVCRGCYRTLDKNTPVEPWQFGVDEQLDEHCRLISRQASAEPTA